MGDACFGRFAIPQNQIFSGKIIPHLLIYVKRGVDVMQELEKKEYYRQAIIDIIMGIDRLDVLMYLHRLISRIVKEGR